jgi:FKBP12-rapamycin complex-associated protein
VIKLDDQAFIDGFDPVIDIIPSKQVPRKLVIRSYDKDFTFLLKGTALRLPVTAKDKADH